uniref:G-type lectin S-receptor-like serine/threonine-protein kinase At4g27290 n=1 Tax=Erigeron canadensis TaxID=72917 RepID=UPI001CB8BF58|nr:G-type lectin S-receptor-like serine/threonine-protein kinase At4g27290 [Erigeron canadensis]
MLVLPFITCLFFLLLTTSSSLLDTITLHQNFTDGETITSLNERYELGFFSPGSSENRYLGIWFKNITPLTVIWVANRETPLKDRFGMVKLGNLGNMSLVDGGGTVVWTSNSSASSTTAVKPIAKLWSSGNLVIMSEDSRDEENHIWQSFDYPGDTIVSGIKLGKNLVTGREIYLTSWKNPDDPSPGEYSMRFLMVKDKYPQGYLWKSSVKLTRFGPYNGYEFAGQTHYNSKDKDIMVLNQEDMHLQFMHNSTIFALMYKLNPDGKLNTTHLIVHNHRWIQDLVIPNDKCDEYGMCGPYESCVSLTPPYCKCLKGFQQGIPETSNSDNRTRGCQRSRPLDCGPREGFLKLPNMKFPDTQNAVYNNSMSLQECEVACKNNCSCTAYANPNITEGAVGCLLWFGDLIDVRVYQATGQDLYVRLAASELLDTNSKLHRTKSVIITVTLTMAVVLVGLVLALYIWTRRKKRSNVEREGMPRTVLDKDNKSSSKNENMELPLFSLSQIYRATNKFSIENKLGQGGFGPVYKGMLEGQEVAVKRLSKSSRQGVDEFKNEVICIAKLQHRNLVKLLGYCNEEDETILVYEYMPNRSLDSFIFDDIRKSQLDWSQRFNIIQGIARGLLYLHQDSRLIVVHRDLKAGNILLDHHMRPKISDFGLARMFTEHESEANTKRVVGTLGYISPEYAVNGQYSTKSDIFSFGVIMLEIVSGQKNRGFVDENQEADNLVGHAWRLYNENKSFDLVDSCLCNSYSTSELMRSVHVGLLCVQNRPEDRPSAQSVIDMLDGEGSLLSPKKPGFFIHRSEINSNTIVPSINGLTLSQVYGR